MNPQVKIEHHVSSNHKRSRDEVEVEADAPSSRTRRTTPSGDKAEHSPNNMANCQSCRTKIWKSQVRIGKDVLYVPNGTYSHKYCHLQCFETDQQSDANLRLELNSGRSVQEELMQHHKDQIALQALQLERSDLREDLRQLRLGYARRLHVPPFFIFDDSVLDQLVATMPQTSKSCFIFVA